MRVVKRLLVIDSGALIGDGPPEQVMVQADVRRAYLGEAHA